jgi:hypothetical protein
MVTTISLDLIAQAKPLNQLTTVASQAEVYDLGGRVDWTAAVQCFFSQLIFSWDQGVALSLLLRLFDSLGLHRQQTCYSHFSWPRIALGASSG